MNGGSDAQWEVYRIRARMYAYTGIQLFGFLLVFWGAFEVIGRILVDHYRSNNTIPESAMPVFNAIPELDAVTAVVLIGAGAVIVHLTTK